MKNLVNKITTLLFLGFIFGVFILNVIKNPTEFSISERRKLAQFPDLSYGSVMNGDFMNEFGDYSVDQTAFREDFRKVKAFFDLNILRKSDNNDIFVHDGYVFKTQYPMNTQSVTRLCGIVNAVCDKYLNESNKIMYSVAPDKNAYIGGSKYLVLDYDEMLTLIRENINGDIPYTDIFGDVSLDCFYRTDTHWRQEDLFPVAATLAAALDSPLPTDFRDSFGYEHFDSFYGVYYGQSALNIPPDGLTWLVSEVTEKALVSSIEKPGQRLTVYDLEQLESPDPYNIFMCGSSAIVTARNMLNRSGRSLIIFRDSFAAPLAPLLLHSYGSVTLIDLRYVSPDLLENYVDFKDADVLFLYSAGLFQNCDSVRGTANSE